MASIDDVARAYNRISCGMGEVVGAGETYREVRLPDWPAEIHYEFLPKTRRYYIELHWQVETSDEIAATFERLAADTAKVFDGLEVNSYHRERQRHVVSIRLPEGLSPLAIAQAMHHFVAWSRYSFSGNARIEKFRA